MAYFLGGDFGGSTIPSTISDAQKGYDPVYGDEVSGEFIWQLLPSAYRALMDNKEVFTHSWEAMIRSISGLLLDAWQTGASYSLKDIPVHQQRKWVRYDLIKEDSFPVDPELTIVGIQDRLQWDGDYFRMSGTWTNRWGHDKYTVPLNGSSTQGGSLSWSVTVAFSDSEAWAGAQFGYFNSADRKEIANALVVGAVGDSTGSIFPFIGHYNTNGLLTSTVGPYELALNTEYSFDAVYEAKDGILSLTLYELHAEKVTGTAGVCDSTTSTDIYTSGFSDADKDFDDAGVVAGDVLIIESDEYEIAEVAGSTLVVSSPSLPAGSSGITYSIVGKLQRSSMSLDLFNLAGDPTFIVDQFGTASLDLRHVSDESGGTLFGGSVPAKARRRSLTGYVDGWKYFDPTVEGSLLSAPVLQDHVTTPEVYLYEGTDFEIVNSAFQFKEPPPTALWAEYSTYDEDVLYNNFGAYVGLDNEVSSEIYRSKIRGLYYAYYQGPTLSSIKTGVQILLGLPIAEEAGVVDSINDAYSGDYGEITIDGTGYLYPLQVGTSLSVGDEVSAFQPLCDGVEVRDYISHPEWFIHLGMHEVQKFHTFAVFLSIDAFDIEDLSSAALFVETIKPTWKSSLFIAHKDMQDEVDIDDDLGFFLSLSLHDIPCDEPPLVTYDSKIYEGEEADWKYDQGVVEWGETSAAMRQTGKDFTSGKLQGIYGDAEIRHYLTGTASLTNGDVTATGTGTAWLTELSGVSYLAVAKTLSGSDGVSTSGDNKFTDTVTGFDGVEAGDVMIINGVNYEVQSVDSSTQVTLDTSLPSDSTGVSWSTVGQLKTWGQISSVSSDSSLTFNTAFSGPSGVYKLTILDPDYREAFHDQFLEQCPDEEMEIVVDISPGYQETQLGGSFTFTSGSTTVSGDGGIDFITVFGDRTDFGTGNGSTDAPGASPIRFTAVGASFLTIVPNTSGVPNNPTRLSIGAHGSITVANVVDDENLELDYDPAFEGLSGEDWELHDTSSVTGKFITSPIGTWHEITSVVDMTTVQVNPMPGSSFSSVISYLADEVLAGSFTFTNGSDQVTCDTSQTGVVSAGDWIQAVPGSEPVVQVASIDVAGTTITLSSSYSGNSVVTGAIRRGDSSVLPLTISLPNGDQSFTDWYGTSGGHLTDTIQEMTW